MLRTEPIQSQPWAASAQCSVRNWQCMRCAGMSFRAHAWGHISDGLQHARGGIERGKGGEKGRGAENSADKVKTKARI